MPHEGSSFRVAWLKRNTGEAERLKVDEGHEVTAKRCGGETRVYARLTNCVKKGMVFMPFHFPGTNILTTEVTDPGAGIPEFKVSACRISRSD